MNQKILEIITEIRTNPGYHDDRCLRTILEQLESGVSINETDKLLNEVQKSYLIGKHVRPSKVKDKFKKTMRFINKELGEFYD